MNSPLIIAAAALAAALVLSGCSEPAAVTAPPAAPTSAAPAFPPALFAAPPAADAKPLAAARASAKAGDTVSFVGYVGGRAEPFTESRAVFLVADLEKAPPRADGCKSPLDACCTPPPEDIAANSATVQVVDAQGAPLKLSLDGQGGMKKGALVTVTGKVREASANVFVVDATGISVKAQ
ncbi:MAG: hypothetical protein SF028_07490 [Candidatus Sumerlaeia bacterium]|nr:hypothetical protein [Candidatus Sumerlaeia bacterium]